MSLPDGASTMVSQDAIAPAARKALARARAMQAGNGRSPARGDNLHDRRLGIGVVTVEGNRRVDADAIKAHFHFTSLAAADPATLDAALKELYATGAFEDIKIARAGDHLVVGVVEAPVIGRVQFEGNRALKDETFGKATALKANSFLTKSAVQADAARIIDIYRQKARYDAQVTPKTITRGEGRVDIVLEIKEGAKTGIKRIVFSGNHAYSEQQLKAIISTSESGWFARKPRRVRP